MKKTLALILSLTLVLTAGLNAFALGYGEEWDTYYHTTTTTYSDVPYTHWAYEAIMRSTEKKWFSGYPDGRFMPDGSITRAEALKVFVVFMGLELDDVTESSFYDVDPGAWYAPYVEAGKDLFPTHTSIQGKRPFQPDMPVTREDAIYALVRALGYDVGVKYVDQSVLNMFSDANSISNDIKPYFVIALNNQLVSGFPDGTIRAQDPLSRAEFATILYRGSFVAHSDAHVTKISTVTVTPESPLEITIGESATLKARATYTDGTNKEYTALDPYDASGNGAIALNGLTITGVKEGTATIKYNDSYLSKDSLVVVVKKPSDAPVLKITDYDTVTEDAKVTVGGSVTDKTNTQIDLTCNGRDVKVNSDGSFSAEVSLSVGENKLEFVAQNGYGVSASKTISIERTKTETAPKEPEKDEDSEKTEKPENNEKPDNDYTVTGEDGTPYLTFDKETGTITKCGTSAADIIIPDKIDGVNVYNIGESAFADCKYLETIELPSTLKSIKADAFADCIRLVEINVPDGVTSIGEGAFSGCSALASAYIPEGVKKIADNLFEGCKRLEEVSLPDGIKTIGESAFEGCKSLMEVVLPETVTTISENAFLDCGSLNVVEIPDKTEKIAENAFEGCNALTIFASVNSYAIEYAKENSIAWEIIE